MSSSTRPFMNVLRRLSPVVVCVVGLRSTAWSIWTHLTSCCCLGRKECTGYFVVHSNSTIAITCHLSRSRTNLSLQKQEVKWSFSEASYLLENQLQVIHFKYKYDCSIYTRHMVAAVSYNKYISIQKQIKKNDVCYEGKWQKSSTRTKQAERPPWTWSRVHTDFASSTDAKVPFRNL